MGLGRHKFIRTSKKYKYVQLHISESGIERWRSKVNGVGRFFDTEIEAAKQSDIALIKNGKKPVNIFKTKK